MKIATRWLQDGALRGHAWPDNSDTRVQLVRLSLAGRFGHPHPVCPNRPAKLCRTSWTRMSESSSQARPDKLDAGVRIVRPSMPSQSAILKPSGGNLQTILRLYMYLQGAFKGLWMGIPVFTGSFSQGLWIVIGIPVFTGCFSKGLWLGMPVFTWRF